MSELSNSISRDVTSKPEENANYHGVQDSIEKQTTQLRTESCSSVSRRDSVNSREHTHNQLHGSSTIEQIKGHHDEGQLTGSLLDRRHSKGILGAVGQTRGSLKTAPEGLEGLAETTEVSLADSAHTNNEPDEKQESRDNTEMHNYGFQSTNGIIITQPRPSIVLPSSRNSVCSIVPMTGNVTLKPKPPLVRRKSLNPRVMTPPGLEILANRGLLAVRQQMETDIKGTLNTFIDIYQIF